jgi:hypothetical protein
VVVVVTTVGTTSVIVVVVVDAVKVDTLGAGVTVVVSGPSPLYIPPMSSYRRTRACSAWGADRGGRRARGIHRFVLLRPPSCPPPLCW